MSVPAGRILEEILGKERAGRGADELCGDERRHVARRNSGEAVRKAAGDVMGGGEGRDQLYGDEGDDELLGQDDDDEINGAEGDDHIFGGDGNDVIRSGPNSGDGRGDELDGGAGADRFIFLEGWSPDTSRSLIRNFDSNVDKIDLSAFAGDARTVVTHTFDAELGASTLVQVDTDGDADFEFGLLVQGLHNPLGNWLVTGTAAEALAAPAPAEPIAASDWLF